MYYRFAVIVIFLLVFVLWVVRFVVIRRNPNMFVSTPSSLRNACATRTANRLAVLVATRQNCGRDLIRRRHQNFFAHAYKKMTDDDAEREYDLYILDKASGPGGLFEKNTNEGKNNCLFRAVIDYIDLRNPNTGVQANPQRLREVCNEWLRQSSERFEPVPDGAVTGDVYLQALSDIFQCTIAVYTQEGGFGLHGSRFIFVAYVTYVPEIKLEDTIRDFKIHIYHVGQREYGHWVAMPK
jgi:OTU-like cysteine protease